MHRPVVLTIAGFDPSSGAGITSDMKVFAAHRLYGLSAITALTVQSTQGVRRVELVSASSLAETLACLAEDGPIAGVKIGMLATAENVAVVTAFLEQARIDRERVVLDPVIRSSSGRELLSNDGVELLENRLLELVGWVTPNVAELLALTKSDGSLQESLTANDISTLAFSLGSGHRGLHIVVTGGDGNPARDLLRSADGSEEWLIAEHIETQATHGTGCAFSSALLANLVAGKSGVEAVSAAKTYVREAMLAAYPVGKGRGPLHHLYLLEEGEATGKNSSTAGF